MKRTNEPQGRTGETGQANLLMKALEVSDRLKADIDNHQIEVKRGVLFNDSGIAWFTDDQGRLIRKGVTGEEAMLESAEFFVKGFPESGSVLYRIGFGKDQIRGYIFARKQVTDG